jgi:two-component system, chemotaxis family, sensor kinase CheA
LLSLVDAVRQMLREIETTGQEGERDDSVLIGTLTRLQQAPAAPTPVTAVSAPESAAEEPAPATSMGDILMQ